MARLLRHRQTKGAVTDRLDLRNTESCSLLYLFSVTLPVRYGPVNVMLLVADSVINNWSTLRRHRQTMAGSDLRI